MRTLLTHPLIVTALDDHTYKVQSVETDPNAIDRVDRCRHIIRFQHGSDEVNGLTEGVLLAILADRRSHASAS